MGGSIVAVIEGEPTSVDPAFDYDFVSGLATSSITEPLLKFCEGDTALCPNLATDWTVSEDGLTYTLTIREGVTFHDGSPMTVDDVVFSLNRVRDPELGSYVGWMLGNVADVTAPDDKTVVITMSQPDALLEYALASTAAHVVSKAFVEVGRRGLRHARRGLHRHRSLQVRGVGLRRLPDAGPQRRLLGQGQRRPLPRRDHHQDPARAHHARGRPGDRRDRLPRQQRALGPVRDGQVLRQRQPAPSRRPSTASGSPSTRSCRPSTTPRSARPSTTPLDKAGLRAALLAGDARTPRPPSSTPRCGPSSRTPGRPPGTPSRPTTRTSRRPPSCSRSRASRTSSTA